ncbi:MAG TPA: VWA domain-containing protein [Victivallales bacterium]|nr:VWA domain-containing protein [Victivallales bacterium]
MNFLKPDILWNLIWIIPIYFIFFKIAGSRRKSALESIIGKRDFQEYTSLSNNKRIIRYWLMLFVIIFIVIALARPFWGYKLLPYTGRGKDMLIVLDVSKSMLSQDIAPTRLSHAKHLIKDLITDTPGDRYGLIAFAGSAFLECPLTEDRNSLFSILKETNISSIPVGGTNIEKAMEVAIRALKAASGNYKAVLLFTDGDELQGDSSNTIRKLRSFKIPLYVVGIGNPKKPGLIQIKDKKGNNKFLKDKMGKLVKSKLNEKQLKKMSLETNGVYIRSTASDPGLKILLKRINNLIPEKYSSNQLTRPLERFQIPLIIAFILLAIWFVLGERRENSV